MGVTICKALSFQKVLTAIAEKSISVVFALLLVPGLLFIHSSPWDALVWALKTGRHLKGRYTNIVSKYPFLSSAKLAEKMEHAQRCWCLPFFSPWNRSRWPRAKHIPDGHTTFPLKSMTSNWTHSKVFCSDMATPKLLPIYVRIGSLNNNPTVLCWIGGAALSMSPHFISSSEPIFLPFWLLGPTCSSFELTRRQPFGCTGNVACISTIPYIVFQDMVLRKHAM